VTVTHRVELEPGSMKVLEGLVAGAVAAITDAIVAALRAQTPPTVAENTGAPPLAATHEKPQPAADPRPPMLAARSANGTGRELVDPTARAAETKPSITSSPSRAAGADAPQLPAPAVAKGVPAMPPQPEPPPRPAVAQVAPAAAVSPPAADAALTKEREAHLAMQYYRGEAIEHITCELNDMRGPRVIAGQVVSWIGKLGLKRGPDFRADQGATKAAPVAKSTGMGGQIDYSEALQWARNSKIDISLCSNRQAVRLKINGARQALGLPQWTIVDDRGRQRDPLPEPRVGASG
jgi:hypothetical protein